MSRFLRAVENLSGYSLDDVKVHYNSPKPAQLKALAYTKGTDIHVAPGQEQHLPHEAWHVVQQKQGRVKGTKQAKGNELINDDPGLEREADMMGAKALQTKSLGGQTAKNSQLTPGIVQMRGRLENIEAADKPRLVLKIVLPGSDCSEWRTHHDEQHEQIARDNAELFDSASLVDNQNAEEAQEAPTVEKYKGRYGNLFKSAKPVHTRTRKNKPINFINNRYIMLKYPGPGAKGTKGRIFTFNKGALDAGSNRIDVNIREVPKDAQKEIQKYRGDNPDCEVIILIKAHSRNAVAGCHIANKLAGTYKSDEKVRIELVAYDPVPGPGKGKKYHNITLDSRINESTVVYSIDSGYWLKGFKPTKVTNAKRYIGTPREHDAGMATGVGYNNKYYRGSDLNSLPSGAFFEHAFKNSPQQLGFLTLAQDSNDVDTWLDWIKEDKFSSQKRGNKEESYRENIIKTLMKNRIAGSP